MIDFTIDGEKVTAEEGTNILQTARANNIEIPTLCHHPALEPFGACRLCTVEVTTGGNTKFVTSCNNPVEQDSVISTKSSDVIEFRKMLIELLLDRAPAAEKIQELAREYGVEIPENTSDEKCILCGLCTRICEQRIGASAINFINRGVDRKVETPFQRTLDINMDACIACGSCAFVCPTGAIDLKDITPKIPVPILSEFDVGLKGRAPIYVPFPQAVPNVPAIDKTKCAHFATGKCKTCEVFCEPNAIDFEQEDEIIEVEVGGIVAATGFTTFEHARYGEYGGGKYPDVISGLQLERLLSASGPTEGEVLRPSDGTHPKSVVFISCVGSRDDKMGKSYCSKICCMYMAKQAIMLKEHDPDVQSYVFYIDNRTGGKNFEEFGRRAQEESNVIYLRGRVSKIYQEGKKLIVLGEDSLMGKPVEIETDLVVLATGIVPNEGVVELAQTLNISYDPNGFLTEAHPKLRPVETQTDGIFVAGACVGPRDVPESVAQGSAAASKVLELLSKEYLLTDPMTSVVDPLKCVGCLLCQEICPFKAVESEVTRDQRTIAKVNESLCKGCGLCSAACRSGAMNLPGFTSQQVLAEVASLWR
ncbi:4Fe-4S binding protein [Chloroflexota bacterium]